MTTVYFIRHAESDNSVRDGKIRPLTEKGLFDIRLVTEFLQDKNIDIVFSSPFKRAVDTVAGFAEKNGFNIETIEGFRERKSDSDMTRDNTDFNTFMERQWNDFSYTLSDGECLREVQERNVAALNQVLISHKDKNIVIGTHGTALSTIINYYDNTYGFKDFMAMVNIMPWVVKMDFDKNGCGGMAKIDLFQSDTTSDNEKYIVNTTELGELKAYRFVVTFARYRDKWMYCKTKGRGTFETAGGHIENGETPLEAAKRELYEETGAVRFDIIPAFDYSVRRPNVYANGQVFFAQIHELGAIPNYEIAVEGVELFDAMPAVNKLRFSQIMPALYEKMQIWLNTQISRA